MEAATRQGWVEWLGEQSFDCFFTATFSDRYAARYSIYGHKSALNTFEAWAREVGLPGNYFVASENSCARDVPHLHGLIELRGVHPSDLWRLWTPRKGRSRFESPRSGEAVSAYCSKYTLKDVQADSVRFDVQMSRRHRARLLRQSKVARIR